jgi:hypothetical protein
MSGSRGSSGSGSSRQPSGRCRLVILSCFIAAPSAWRPAPANLVSDGPAGRSGSRPGRRAPTAGWRRTHPSSMRRRLLPAQIQRPQARPAPAGPVRFRPEPVRFRPPAGGASGPLPLAPLAGGRPVSPPGAGPATGRRCHRGGAPIPARAGIPGEPMTPRAAAALPAPAEPGPPPRGRAAGEQLLAGLVRGAHRCVAGRGTPRGNWNPAPFAVTPGSGKRVSRGPAGLPRNQASLAQRAGRRPRRSSHRPHGSRVIPARPSCWPDLRAPRRTHVSLL